MNSKTLEVGGIRLAYQLFMLVLCIYAITALTFGVIFPLGEQVSLVIQYVDLVVCIVFFADFLQSLYRSQDRVRYFLTWGWIDLLSSLPMIDAFRAGRIIRLLRIIRVLRALRATKALSTYFIGRRSESVIYSVLAITFLMLAFSSIAVLSFEGGADGNIKTAEDALWWAATTITTVGYGDRFPITAEGRAVAVLLMTVGVGLFGVLSGLIASWFIVPTEDGRHREIAELRSAIVSLEATLLRQRSESHPTESRQSPADVGRTSEGEGN